MNRRTFIQMAGAVAGLFAVGGSLSTATAVAEPSEWTQEQENVLAVAAYARRIARAEGWPCRTWRDVAAIWDPQGAYFAEYIRDFAGFHLDAPVPWPAATRAYSASMERIRHTYGPQIRAREAGGQ